MTQDMRQTRETLAGLRSQLAALEQKYNEYAPPDGQITLGRRSREAHQIILAEMMVVRGAIEQCEKELGDA